MAIPFSLVCSLLETLHEQCAAGKHRQTRDTLERWFNHHRRLIRALDARHGAALLSTLLPARRTDRVYCIQAPRLEKIFARAQRLGVSRIAELHRYKVPGAGVDLADCVFAILGAAPNPAQHVTVSEVDDLLGAVASTVAFSSPAVRAAGAALTDAHRKGLESMYMRLTALEAKWFTRLILKDYRPIELDEAAVLENYHPVLPCIVKVLDHFCPALAVLDRAGGAASNFSRRAILSHLRPALGTKVGRPPWRKAWSIKHCIDMGRGRMSVEKKVDGEYCQVHVDLSMGQECIQIFSKSGKDSTEDRRRLHRAIRESLDIGRASCKIKKGCILEGELVVYSDLEQRILSFHKIRNHVTRSGRCINNGMDSPPRAHEHLMIIYYDMFLIDDESLLGVRHSERYERLKSLIVTRPGYAELIDRRTIDIGSPRAASDLRKIFAEAIVAREEGLVLKPDDPFIDLDRSASLCGSPIKFKKEYIGNFGDVGDFAVVGARYDPGKAKGYHRIPGLKWTHFYLGCASSKNELYTAGATPEFTVVAVVDLNETMLRTVVQAQPPTVPAKDNDAFKLTIPLGIAQGKHPTVIFTTPLVFDIRCFSFGKEGNVGFFTPRFPVVSKVHFDRDYRDAITFPDLQELAEKATAEREWEKRDSQEMLGWVAALEGADPGGRAADCVSQDTVSSGLTPPTGSSGDAPEEVSVVSPASSAASGPMSSRSGVTLTPPTSLPGEPSSEAEDGDRPDSPCVKKRKPVGDDHGHVRVGFPPKRRDSRSEDCESARRSRGVSSELVGAVERTTGDGTYGALHHGMGLDGASSQPLLASSPPPDVSATTRARSPESTWTTSDPPNTLPRLEPLNQCPLRGPNCAFHDRPLLLPPSLTTRKDVRRALRQHGITSYTTNLAAWQPEDIHRPDTWKICFVDADDEVGTRVFLKESEKRPLRRAGGREYIEVYDWRVLLGVGDVEREGGSRMKKGRDPFRRWFVGLV